tara:strand:+ start:3163 stop:3405 length:243 start_codon:yes stop_codon:yes gene_type:complete
MSDIDDLVCDCINYGQFIEQLYRAENKAKMHPGSHFWENHVEDIKYKRKLCRDRLLKRANKFESFTLRKTLRSFDSKENK